MHAPEGFAASWVESDEALPGGCLCGAVRYRLLSRPVDVAHCHCITCRRSAGTPFITWATLPRTHIAITHGKVRPFRSSSHATRWFCENCGTQLFFLDDAETTADVTVGSLDDPDALRPLYNTYAHGRLKFMQGFDASLPDDPDFGVGTAPKPRSPTPAKD